MVNRSQVYSISCTERLRITEIVHSAPTEVGSGNQPEKLAEAFEASDGVVERLLS